MWIKKFIRISKRLVDIENMYPQKEHYGQFVKTLQLAVLKEEFPDRDFSTNVSTLEQLYKALRKEECNFFKETFINLMDVRRSLKKGKAYPVSKIKFDCPEHIVKDKKIPATKKNIKYVTLLGQSLVNDYLQIKNY